MGAQLFRFDVIYKQTSLSAEPGGLFSRHTRR